MAFLPALAVPSILKAILAPLASLWRWLTEEPVRVGIFVLLCVIALLAVRIDAIDSSRDEWRTKATHYEKESAKTRQLDKIADKLAVETAKASASKVMDENEMARAAAANSEDPLKAGVDSLRKREERR